MEKPVPQYQAKKEKTLIPDEYCRNTGQARKYAIWKIQPGVDLRPKQRKKRRKAYDDQITAALAKVWEIFDHPCGQRLKSVLEVELEGGGNCIILKSTVHPGW